MLPNRYREFWSSSPTFGRLISLFKTCIYHFKKLYQATLIRTNFFLLYQNVRSLGLRLHWHEITRSTMKTDEKLTGADNSHEKTGQVLKAKFQINQTSIMTHYFLRAQVNVFGFWLYLYSWVKKDRQASAGSLKSSSLSAQWKVHRLLSQNWIAFAKGFGDHTESGTPTSMDKFPNSRIHK